MNQNTSRKFSSTVSNIATLGSKQHVYYKNVMVLIALMLLSQKGQSVTHHLVQEKYPMLNPGCSMHILKEMELFFV